MQCDLTDGANSYLRIGWRTQGLKAEISTFKELLEAGLEIEGTEIQSTHEGLQMLRSPRCIFEKNRQLPVC